MLSMIICKNCKYIDNFTRLKIYCQDCIEKLNDRVRLQTYSSKKYLIPKRRRKKKKFVHVKNLPLLQVEFNYLTNLINNSEKDYTIACKHIHDRIFTIGIIYNICGPDSERFKTHITNLKIKIIHLCAKILSAQY